MTKAIGEEMSEEALKFWDREISVPRLLTLDNPAISHIYCDPELKEQEEFEIKQPGYFVQGRQLPEIVPLPPEVKDLSQEEAEQLEWQEGLKREPIWLVKILEFNRWPLLFICGSLS